MTPASEKKMIFAGLAPSVDAAKWRCLFILPATFATTLLALNLLLLKKLTRALLDDLMYMLDDLIVFTIALKTLSLKVFSPKITQVMPFVGGIILLLLGAVLRLKPALLTTLS